MQRLSLATGWPSPHLLPTASVARAAAAALSDPAIATPALLYGPDEGYGPLRRELARWLADFYRQPGLTPDRFAITGGASQALACILQVYADPAYTLDVLFVAPSYMMIFPTFEDNGFAGEGRMLGVPEDEEGCDVGVLRERLVESERRAREREGKGDGVKLFKPRRSYSKYYRHLIYCVPTFSNPSSRTMTLARRTALVSLAREFDALIIADDVYDFLQWPANPSPSTPSPSPPMKHATLPRLIDIDRTLSGGPDRPGADGFGNVVSNATFSKICGPGVRVGWNEGSPRFAAGVARCGSSTSGGAPSQLTSTYMCGLLQDGTLQTHIFDVLQPAYARRYATLVRAVEKHLVPLGARMPQPGREVVGGYFVWVLLPGEVGATAYAKRCVDEVDVPILAGPRFEIPGDASLTFEHHVRLCFSWIDEELMEEAVRRIAGVLRGMLAEK